MEINATGKLTPLNRLLMESTSNKSNSKSDTYGTSSAPGQFKDSTTSQLFEPPKPAQEILEEGNTVKPGNYKSGPFGLKV